MSGRWINAGRRTVGRMVRPRDVAWDVRMTIGGQGVPNVKKHQNVLKEG
jgi:hypothetical protein